VRRRAIRGALLVGLLAVVSAGIASAAGQMDFSDPQGDAGSAPDITAVTVSNDDSGVITFRLTIANRTAIGPDDVVAVQIGTDDPDFFAGLRSDGTGYVLAIDSQGPYLLKWTGSDLPEVKPPPKSLTGSFSGNVATISIKQEDLAPGFPDMSLPVELRFNAVGVLFQGIVATAEDFAPALDSKWSYRLVEPARMVVTNFDADKTIKAGKQLVVLLGAAQSDTGAPVSAGKVTCPARLGGKALNGAGKFVTLNLTSPTTGRKITTSSASCSFRVPKGTKGKTIRGSMSVTAVGVTLKRTFTTKVR
jgi:hypothetical protein